MNQNRNTLKGFFTKGAIPSQENFADLIDSAINQNDDGITKLPTDPLRINASGPGDTVLNFYQKATDSKPAWALSLNSGDAPAKAGLNVSSSHGGSRLFIDYTSGKIGIGNFTPRTSLDVNGEIVAVTRLTLAQDTGTTTKTWHVDNSSGLFRLFWQPNINTVGTLAVAATTDGNVGIGMDKPVAKLDIGSGVLHVAGQVDPKVTEPGAYLSWNTLSGSTCETDFINNQGKGPGGFVFMNTPSSGTPRTTLMFISGAGKVGIGTTDPKDSLDLAGGARILTDSNPIRFTSGWSMFPNVATKDKATDKKNRAEISNDTDSYKELMIVGNASAGTENPLGTDWLQRRVGVWDRLDVHGELVQHAPMIDCKQRGDWDKSDHPIQKYFRERLADQAPGTMLCVMGDAWLSEPHYWIGCVCADKKAYITYLKPTSHAL
jgi:hypothetical protein